MHKLGSRAFAKYRCMLLSYASTIRIIVVNNLCICLRKVPDERLSGVTHLLIPNRRGYSFLALHAGYFFILLLSSADFN